MAPSATNGTNGSNGTSKLQFDTFKNVINGKLVGSSQTRHGINPATKKPNAEVPVATQKDVDDAIAAAKVAFKTWSRTSVEERREKILAYAEALKEHTNEFAKLLTTEQGKPLMFAAMEVGDGHKWLSEMGKLEVPEEVVEDNEDRKVITRYTPLGVVAAIVPWNFPVQLGMFSSKYIQSKADQTESLWKDCPCAFDRKLHHHQA
jgi:acyl-CoA reductase-like NAD-dependent aldehyde dehydrogenase